MQSFLEGIEAHCCRVPYQKRHPGQAKAKGRKQDPGFLRHHHWLRRSKVFEKVPKPLDTHVCRSFDKMRMQPTCACSERGSVRMCAENVTELDNHRPDDRSFSDLCTLLELVARLPFLDACTSVEKFAIVRTGRLQQFKSGQTGFHRHRPFLKSHILVGFATACDCRWQSQPPATPVTADLQ